MGNTDDDTGRKIILPVEDEADVRISLKLILEENYNVLEASDYLQSLNHIHKHIDIAIIDYILPDRNGFEVLNAIRKVKPMLPAIMMTGHGTEDVAITALRAGFTDYIKKPPDIPYLLKRIDEVMNHPSVSCKASPLPRWEGIKGRVKISSKPPHPSPLPQGEGEFLRNTERSEVLSEREMEVLKWIKQGKTNMEISSILRISERTIKFHVCSIIKKLGCRNRTHAVSIAIEQGLIDKE